MVAISSLAIHAELGPETESVIAARIGEVADEAVGGGSGDAVTRFPRGERRKGQARDVRNRGLVLYRNERDELLREAQRRELEQHQTRQRMKLLRDRLDAASYEN